MLKSLRSLELAAIIVGRLGIFLQWFTAPEGLGLIVAGLSILGVDTGGSLAGQHPQSIADSVT
jgi:hypothetical protein